MASDTLPARGLSRLRRHKDKNAVNASQQSLPFSVDDGSQLDSQSSGLRSSLDQAIDKVKEKTRERRSSDASARRRLASLVPERIRRPKRNETSPLRNKSSDQSLDHRPLSLLNNDSDSSLTLTDDDGTRSSSLFTVDAADTDGNPIRPSLSTHQSHTGYLTLSSPEIIAKTESVASDQPDPALLPDIGAVDQPLVPQIIEHSATEPFPELPVQEPSTSSAGQLIDPVKLVQDRSPSPTPSPARKLKSAFKLSRKKSSDNLATDKASDQQKRGPAKSSSRRASIDTSTSNVSEHTQRPEIKPSVPPLPKAQPETPRDRGRSPGVAVPLPPHEFDTPKTVVTPPTPTDTSFEFTRIPPTSAPKSSTPPARSRGLNSVESIKHRRAQSANLPSRLSNSIPAPLTPTLEETKTPGGTLTQPTSATGFFSSFFSAAQKAADQLNSSINGSIGPKGKASNKEQADDLGGEEVIVGTQAQPDTKNSSEEQRPKAVETLGRGDLSLSHLGISDTQSHSAMNTVAELPEQTADSQQEITSRKAEEEAAARAVSSAYEKPVERIVSQATGRPLSISSNDRLPLNGESSPPARIGVEDALKRSGSVRSKLSGRRRKHRNSSTNTSITAALQTSATGLANLQANGPGHRLTGFAVASSKRNKDFHQLFRSVPEDDYLIEDYSAALQRDILLHGRLYVSEGHICFSSNILGWVTNLVVGFDEVVSVEKKSTAVIFPNAIVIQTLHARNTFASFVARDSTYELLIGIWKINHPNLKSSLNGVTLDNAGTGDKTEVAEPQGSEEETADGSDDEVYDEDEDDDMASFSEAGALSAPTSEPAPEARPPLSRKPSNSPLATAGPLPNGTASKGSDGAESAMSQPAAKVEVLGPSAHAPTECGEASEHYDRALIDANIPAPLGKVYSLMWGPESSAFMRKWLVDEMKSRELNYAEDKFGLDNSHKTIVIDYIKPLNAPIGPKQTKCITTNTLVALDLEKAVSVDCSSSTPDVPNGNAFVTKTRYCLMWGPSNSTRLVATCTIEWSGKSWIKGAIEKGAQEGQTSYVKDLVAALKTALASKASGKVAGKKGRRKGKTDSGNIGDVITHREAAIVAEQKPTNWGLFEPLHTILEPVLDLVRPFITSQVVIAVMFVLLAYTWLIPPRSGVSVGLPGFVSPDRLAAYEELWRREESDLWDWLEERVGVEGIYASDIRTSDEHDRQRVLQARAMGQKLEKEKMKERQVDDAIRTTEERLRALKVAVDKRRLAKEQGI